MRWLLFPHLSPSHSCEGAKGVLARVLVQPPVVSLVLRGGLVGLVVPLLQLGMALVGLTWLR